MGAGILPTALHDGTLYFLFGKENQYEDSAPGFSDFGGGTDGRETFLQTAVREAGEELTGFLGNEAEIRRLLRRAFTIDYNPTQDTTKGNGETKRKKNKRVRTQHKRTQRTQNQPQKYGTYRVHLFPYAYNEWLPYFYNNNQRFLQKHLDPHVIRTAKIFEKAEIRWVSVNDLTHMLPHFRPYFRDIVGLILDRRTEIHQFMSEI